MATQTKKPVLLPNQAYPSETASLALRASSMTADGYYSAKLELMHVYNMHWVEGMDGWEQIGLRGNVALKSHDLILQSLGWSYRLLYDY